MALLEGTLVVRGVPYLTGAGTVAHGTLLVPLTLQGDAVVAPSTHAAWWIGSQPHEDAGGPLASINVTPTGSPLKLSGLDPAWTFCAKPGGREFRDHREYVMTYVALLGVPVATVDPKATARTYTGSPPNPLRSSPFVYRDTASARAGLEGVNQSISGQTVGIVGLGGTGSYVLDLVSKSMVDAIHLFDDDLFEQHSAFRAPGAAAVRQLRESRSKVDHFASVYGNIRRHVIPHPVRIDRRTAPLLDVLDFAFVCCDDPASKPAIFERLADRRIPFVDVGMGLVVEGTGIHGAVRTTFVAPGDDVMRSRIPTVGAPDGDIYSSNIQICELNALNASLAVIAWKRHFGFYGSDGPEGNGVFVVNSGRMFHEGAEGSN